MYENVGIHVLGKEFMDAMDRVPTFIVPCTGKQPPQIDYPYPKTAQTCPCGEQDHTLALCQDLNTVNTKGELLLSADHGT